MASVLVVPAFDECEDCRFRFGQEPEAESVSQLALERGEEALAERVVIAVSDRSHRRGYSVLPETAAEFDRCVLTTLIRVMNDSLMRFSLLESHIESRGHQFGAEMVLHGPAHDFAAPDINDHCQIQKVLARGRNVGDVGDPELIRSRGREVPLDQIGGRPRRAILLRGPRPFAAADAHELVLSHQTSDSLASDRTSFGLQLLVDARGSIGSARPPINRFDLLAEHLVVLPPLGTPPVFPRVVTALGNLQHAAHGRHGVRGFAFTNSKIRSVQRWFPERTRPRLFLEFPVLPSDAGSPAAAAGAHSAPAWSNHPLAALRRCQPA